MIHQPGRPSDPPRSTSWRDHRDRPVWAPPVPEADDRPFYRGIGEHQGDSYRRNAFAAGTAEELATLCELAGLQAGDRVLDVGCGDGRHLRALIAAEPSIRGVGVDASPALIEAGRRAAEAAGIDVALVVADARDPQLLADLRLADLRSSDAVSGAATCGAWRPQGGFDVVWSVHQGALGTSPQTDPQVLSSMAKAVKPGGLVAATFFHALFAARHLAPGDAFDTVALVHHQRSEVYGRDEERATFDLWTSSYTAREVAQLITEVGLELVSIRGVQPGRYGQRSAGEVGLDDPEMLVIARKRVRRDHQVRAE